MTPMDPGRLARAATLQVLPLGNGRFVVSGGAAAHDVYLPPALSGSRASFAAWCDCGDFLGGVLSGNPRACKHILAVAITLATDEERAEIASMLGIG